MALSSTIHRVRLELADIDRGVYESLDLRVARHPSEDGERVVVRLLARAIAHEDGLEFGRGLSHTEDPALWTHSPHGAVSTWIDVGAPSAERLHRASKRADQVRVFTHKPAANLRREWSSRTIYHADQIEIVQLPVALVRVLSERLGRTLTWFVTIQEDGLTVVDGEDNFEGALLRANLAAFLAR